MDLCDFCCKWVGEHRRKGTTETYEDYPEMMREVLVREMLLSRDAADAFIDDACAGNWKRLHETAAEKQADAEDYAKLLLDDVWYCSDRWSWDRVLRIQWLYQQLRWRIEFAPLLESGGGDD